MKKFMLIAIFFFSLKSFAVENQFRNYLEQKVQCNYAEAIDILENWTISLDDPAEIELNLFRLFELVKYPELTDRAVSAYHSISGNIAVTENPFLKSRLDLFLNRLYLKRGNIGNALKKRDNSGFFNKYTILLPDNFSDIFTYRSDINEQAGNIKSFTASIDNEGRINIQELLGSSFHRTVYMVSGFSVPEDSEYCLAIGKTGHTSVYIDGNKIFSSYSRHAFCHDQYFVKVFLTEGTHNLWMKAGSSKDGSIISLRLTDRNGIPINPEGNSDSIAKNYAGNVNGTCSLISSRYFHSLKSCLSQKENYYDAFNTGYLFYAANLIDEESGNFKKYFSAAADDELLKSVSLYYFGMLENDSSLRNSLFKKSLNAFNGNIESMLETVKLKLNNDYIYDACKITELIKTADPFSAEIRKYRALIFTKSGWNPAALKECEKLNQSGFKSYTYEIENIIYTGENRYRDAALACYNLFKLDKTDSVNFRNLTDNLIKAGMYDKADSILNQSAKLFPNNVRLRLKHAELTEHTQGPAKALPYILHAKRLSPFNSDVLLKTGLIYHKLNSNETAFQYMRKALHIDTDNQWIREYITFINKEKASEKNSNPPFSAGKNDFEIKPVTLPVIEKASDNKNSIKQWLVSGPYSKYGPADLDYSFLPEIIDLKEIPGLKKVTLKDSETALNLKKYNFPENGIAYAATAFKCKDTVLIKIYSESAYKIFINGNTVSKKPVTGFFNTPHIIKINSTDKISMMIKLYMEKEADAGLKAVITDENDKIILPDYIAFSNKPDKALLSEELNSQNHLSDNLYQNNESGNFLQTLEKAELFLDSGYEAEFEKIINLLLNEHPESDKVSKLAVKYYKEKNLHKAIEILKTVLPHSQSANSYKQLASVYYKAGMYNEIIKLGKSADPDFFGKEFINSLILTGNLSEAKKNIFRGLLNKNDPLYNIKLGEISYNKGNDPSMYWDKALSIQPSNFELRDFKNYQGTGAIDNPFKKYESDFNSVDINDNQQNPVHIISRKMIFKFFNDGGSRLFCEDFIQFNETDPADKYKKYRVPFNGKIHPVKILIYKDGAVTDYHDIINNNNGRYINLETVTDGSAVNISYYIDNPVSPKGLNFFSASDIMIKRKEEALSYFFLKAIAPEDIKFEFNINRDFKIQSELSENKNIYSIELKDLPGKEKENTCLSFSNMKDPADFVMWYSGLIQTKYSLLNKSFLSEFKKSNSADTVKSVFEFVSEKIVLTGNDLFSPENPADIIKEKKGSAEDKAVLASIILKQLGIKAYLAFTGKNPGLYTDCIFPEMFNRILLYAPLNMKKGLWLDFSNEKNKSGAPGNDVSGKDALILIGNSYEIKKVKPVRDES
ncbi:MAG: hypothetical protein JW864_08165 [Spirochaetes bacterium]|nr:hypothetical protein [Spirochaetota bacterium]